MKKVYLDHNATAPLRPEARKALEEALDLGLGNPSSVHHRGRAARAVVDEARERIAGALGVAEEELTFTSGGTEALNLAIIGVMGEAPAQGGLVTCQTEHSAVLGACALAADRGAQLTTLGVDDLGRVDLESDREALGAAHLVAIASANGETGTQQDLGAVRVAMGGEDRGLLCVDGVQSLGREPLSWLKEFADMAAFSAHKVGGPQGVGFLWKNRRASLGPLCAGGGQEEGLRPGTENVAGIHAASIAVELAAREAREQAPRQRALLTTLAQGLFAAFPQLDLNGPPVEDAGRLPNTLNVAFPGAEGRILVVRLDLAGLEVSAGSACASGSLEPSHVLLAMGQGEERARAGLRISLGPTTTEQDIHSAVDILRKTLR